MALALGAVALIAIAALIVGIIDLTRPTTSPAGAATATATPSSRFTSQQAANAKKNLCDVYQIAARSVKEDTNGGDRAMANVSLTNAAAMLDVASNDPALVGSERDAARALASAYRTVVAIGSVFEKTSSVGQGALGDANRADSAMASICS